MIDTHLYKHNKDKRQNIDKTNINNNKNDINTNNSKKLLSELNADMDDVIHERSYNVSVYINMKWNDTSQKRIGNKQTKN